MENVTILDPGVRPSAPKSRVAVQQWESLEQIQKWRSSAEYKEIRQIGDKYANFRSYAVVGMPQP